MLRDRSKLVKVAFVLPSGEIVTCNPASMLRLYDPIQSMKAGWTGCKAVERRENLTRLGVSHGESQRFVKAHRESRIVGVVKVQPRAGTRASRIEQRPRKLNNHIAFEWLEVLPGGGRQVPLLIF